MANKNTKYNAAVVGCGRIGAEEKHYNKKIQPGTHAGAYLMNKKIQLVALVDKDKDKLAAARKYFPETRLYTDIEDMLKKHKIDIISIATPTKCHYNDVLCAARYKCRAVVCEKPLSYKIAEARRMIVACKKNGSQLFVNHQRHFDPLLQKWSRKIKQGLLGEIYQGNAYYYNGLMNNGTHLVDLLIFFGGDPVSVVGRFNEKTSSTSEDMNVDGLIIFKNDTLVSLQSLGKNYGYADLTLLGEKGMFSIRDLGFRIEYRKKIRNRNFKGYFELSENAITEGKPRSWLSGTINHAVSFLEKRAEPVSTGRDALMVLRILVALRYSAEYNGEEVYL